MKERCSARCSHGIQRAAAGTDSDTHTQRYALRIANSQLDPTQGVPLIESLQVTTPLRAELASVGNQPEYPIELPVSTSLASVSSPALIRVTRPMGEPTTAEKTQPQGQVAIRLYVSNANGTEVPVQVTIPCRQSPRLLQVATWEPIRPKNDFGLALLITLLLNLYRPTT